MNINQKNNVVKMAIRLGTFVSTATLVVKAVEEVLPMQDMTKSERFVLGLGAAGLAYAAGYHAAMFVDNLMDGDVMSDLIEGKEGKE